MARRYVSGVEIDDARGDWVEQANCLSTDPEMWFTEDDSADDLEFPGSPEDKTARARRRKRTIELAQAICAECPVRLRCLDTAMEDERMLARRWRFGIRGGLTPKERHTLALLQGDPANCRPIDHGTESGYQAHGRHGTPPCERCRNAYTSAQNQRRTDHAHAAGYGSRGDRCAS